MLALFVLSRILLVLNLCSYCSGRTPSGE